MTFSYWRLIADCGVQLAQCAMLIWLLKQMGHPAFGGRDATNLG